MNMYLRGATKLGINVTNGTSTIECETSPCDLNLTGDINYTGFFSSDNASYNSLSPTLYNVTLDYTSGNDTKAPTWDEIPTNWSGDNETSVGVDFNASDNVGIDTYWIDNTTYFDINNSGYFYNTSVPPVGNYTFNVSVNDTNGNINSIIYGVEITEYIIIPPLSYSYVLINKTYSYTSYEDNTGIFTAHRFGYFLAVASIIGFVGVLVGLKGGWKSE